MQDVTDLIVSLPDLGVAMPDGIIIARRIEDRFRYTPQRAIFLLLAPERRYIVVEYADAADLSRPQARAWYFDFAEAVSNYLWEGYEP